MIRIGSLFSGIGGLELGIERGLSKEGIEASTVWQVEKSPFCRSILKKHWPQSKRFEDVRQRNNLATVDILCGGFPCQDLSFAGKGAGIDGPRSGLFREMARIVGEIRPRIWVMENVPAIRTRGLDTVVGTIADLGYSAVWGTISGSGVGAPHRRRRWFCIAMANTTGTGLEGCGKDTGQPQKPEPRHGRRHRIDRAGEAIPRMGRGSHGVPAGLDGSRWPASPGEPQHPWEPDRLKTRIPGDKERLIALGNAVIPACAEEIGRAIGRKVLK